MNALRAVGVFVGVALLGWAWAPHATQAQMQWAPTALAVSTGYWIAEQGPVQEAVDFPSFGVRLEWLTQASNGWAAHYAGIEHGGFAGFHHTGSEAYGWQGQAGWVLRTRQLRMVGCSFAGGVAYNSVTYDAETRPDMIAVGTHLNGLVRLGVTLANKSLVGLDLGILHTSNGALRRPNQGINTVQGTLLIKPWAMPRRFVLADGAAIGTWRSMVGLTLAGRDHGAYGGTMYGVQEVWAQTSYLWSTKYGVTGNASVVHHGARRADPTTGEPSDTLNTAVVERLQPAGCVGWTWMFGRARLDVLKGRVFANPTPGFLPGFNKVQVFMRLSDELDVFAALRFTDWRADYLGAGLALRWGGPDSDCNTCPSWKY